jgi:hypothetical protein
MNNKTMGKEIANPIQREQFIKDNADACENKGYMKKYIGTKEVSATPAWQIDGTVYPKDGVVPRSMNRKDGYKVVYEDGYESWSPKDVFEKAYKPSDTVLDRLKIERDELKERIEKIEALLGNGIYEVVKKEGGIPQAVLLILQDSYMTTYLKVLETRIDLMEEGK